VVIFFVKKYNRATRHANRSYGDIRLIYIGAHTEREIHLYIYMYIFVSGWRPSGYTMGQIGWGGPSTGPTLLFGAAGASPCRCEPLRAGCCGGRGC